MAGFPTPRPSGDWTPVDNDSMKKSSIYKSRHISLQSRVDSIAAESLYDWRESRPDLPAAYRQHKSTSYILNPRHTGHFNQWEYDPEPMAVPQSPTDVRDGGAPPAKLIEMSLTREICFVAICAASHLMTQAALGQALAPIDIIAEDFGTTNPGEMSWFIAGYSLTVGTFIMISGRLGDIMGHKRVFCFGYAWFGVWSCFAGFSIYPKRQIFFDVCRALQGIGPALLMPNALALFGRAYSPGIRKNIVFSFFGAAAPAGFVIGALSGSFFGQIAWWPWAFWSFGIANFGLCILSLFIIPKALSDRPSKKPGFDWTGSTVGVCGLVLVNVAFNNAPLYGWGKPHVYFILIIGLMFLGAFGWVEKRAENPLLPMHALNSTVGFVLACVGVGWGAFGVWVFYSWRFLALVRGSSPLSASAQYVPAIISGLIASGMTGFLMTHTPVSFVMMTSMVAFFVGIVIAGTQPAHQTYWAQMFVSVIIMPFGMDMSFPAASIILSNHMPREHQGLAMSLVNTVVNYSISLALGIAGTVEVYGNKDLANIEWGIRLAYYTAMGLSGLGVLLGGAFFAKSWLKEGWKVMEH